jgi:two-component system KDP operon response regulator KdpE
MIDQAEARASSSRSQGADGGAQDDQPITVLVVEDDPSVAEVLTTALGARDHTVIVTRTGQAAVRAVAASEPDAVLLDLGLPDIDGIEVCRRIRSRSSVPLIVVTADGDEDRMVSALDLGANDYVTKPFSMPELMARLRAALRNRRPTSDLDEGLSLRQLGGLTIDIEAHLVTVNDARVHLTQKEFALLAALARRPNSLLTHPAIMDAVWPSGGGTTESLRVHVTNLRRKLGPDGGVEVQTEPGVGYRLVVADDV